MNPSTLHLLRQTTGTWLETELQTVLPRLVTDPTRPLLSGDPGAQCDPGCHRRTASSRPWERPDCLATVDRALWKTLMLRTHCCETALLG